MELEMEDIFDFFRLVVRCVPSCSDECVLHSIKFLSVVALEGIETHYLRNGFRIIADWLFVTCRTIAECPFNAVPWQNRERGEPFFTEQFDWRVAKNPIRVLNQEILYVSIFPLAHEGTHLSALFEVHLVPFGVKCRVSDIICGSDRRPTRSLRSLVP